MVGLTRAIDPRPVLADSLALARERYADAEAALAAGNYPAALAMAELHDEATHAAAEIMCGAVSPGLRRLEESGSDSPADHFYGAFALWCLGRNDEALRRLDGAAGGAAAGRLAALIARAPIDVLVFSMPGSAKASAFAEADGFRVFPVELTPDRFGTPFSEIAASLPPDAAPALALSIDAYGAYLPEGLAEAEIAKVFWAGDHDFFVATRYDDLASADAIVVNSTAEHLEMSSVYGARLAAFPGHESYEPANAFPPPPDAAEKTIDILFTGRAFTPYMRDKAQYLYRLAVAADPDLEVRIVDDYLDDDAYRAALRRARFVPLFWRYTGGLQTRAIDALRQSAFVLSPENLSAGALLGGEDAGFVPVAAAVDDETLAGLAHAYAERWARFAEDDAPRAAFRDLFWPSPAREARFLKFALLQTVLADVARTRGMRTSAVPVELRGYAKAQGAEVYGSIAARNLGARETTARHFNNAGAAAFYASILVEDRIDLGEMALEAFGHGRAQYPAALALRFNLGRILWLFGRRDAARAELAEIAENADTLEFDPRGDTLLSHRVRQLAEPFPYGDYYRAVVDGLAAGDAAQTRARRLIAATAQVYEGIARLEAGDAAAAAEILRVASSCPGHHPAQAHLVEALAQTGGFDADLKVAFAAAVDAYPPHLIALVPHALKALLNEDREAEAAALARDWTLLVHRRRDREGRIFPPPPEAFAAVAGLRRLLSPRVAAFLDGIAASAEIAGSKRAVS